MQHILYIAIGGAVGSVLRYLVSIGIHALLGRGFPYGTLTVNVLGSFAMGILYIILVERLSESAELRALLLIGLLGAFTTFSTFSIETFNLLEGGEIMKAALNVLLSVIICLFAVWAGIILGRQL